MSTTTTNLNKMKTNYTDRKKEIYRTIGHALASSFLEIIEERNLVEWFYTPNKNLNNSTPIEIARTGTKGIKTLERICYSLRSGEPQ